jgi:hypothetical protein
MSDLAWQSARIDRLEELLAERDTKIERLRAENTHLNGQIRLLTQILKLEFAKSAASREGRAAFAEWQKTRRALGGLRTLLEAWQRIRGMPDRAQWIDEAGWQRAMDLYIETGRTLEFWEREASVGGDGYCPLCMAAEIERLRAQNAYAAVFLDGLARRMEASFPDGAGWIDEAAADCRAMAKKLQVK